jgi:hypothetical protein
LAFYSRREADHSPPSSAEVKEWVELYLHSPRRLHGVVHSWGGGHRESNERVAANVLNKQSQPADEGWSSSLVFGHGANNPLP